MARTKKRPDKGDKGDKGEAKQPDGESAKQERARKRARQEPADIRDAEEAEDIDGVDNIIAEDEVPQQEQEQGGPNRREGMADIARRRAAHFALFQADEAETVTNAHTGGTEARNLGPWSSAMELVNARAAAAAARQGRISEVAKAGISSLADDSIVWSPKRDPKLGPRPPNTVGTLFQSCIALLVDHIEDVESLWGIPDIIKIKLSAALCRARKLSPEVAALICGGQPDEVVIPDCTQLKEEDFVAVLKQLSTGRLERLSLNLCGRGFGDAAATALTRGHRLESLRVLSLGGAYRLTDAGLQSILKLVPNLQELHLPQCCRIQGPALQKLPTQTPQLRVLNLADCRGLGAESLKAILCGAANLSQLEALALDGIAEVDDALITEICLALPLLSRLSLKFCSLITDEGVRGIAAGCGPRLTDLRLDELTSVTDEGLIALSASCLNLQVIRLQRCTKVTDAGIASVASAGQLRILGANKLHEIGTLTIKALVATCSEKLEEVDFSWCRGINGNALGLLVDSCPNLKKVTIFGCSQIGKNFLHGHSTENLEIVGATEQRTGPAEFVKLKLIANEDDQEEEVQETKQVQETVVA